MNKFYKVLRIIFLTLAIVSMLFLLMKRVGLAASGGGSDTEGLVRSFPLPFGFDSGYGLTVEQSSYLSQLDYDSIIAQCNSIRPAPYDIVCLVDWTSSENFILGLYSTEWTMSINSETLSSQSNIPFEFCVGVKYHDGYWDPWAGNYYNPSINIGSHVTSLPDGSVYLEEGEFITFYPIYAFDSSLYTDSGFEVFSTSVPDSGSSYPEWTSKGKFLQNLKENSSELSSDQDLPSVDTSSPADPSNNASWFQKILNGLKVISENIKAGVYTLGQSIGSFFDSLMDLIDDSVSKIQQSLQLVIDTITDKFQDFIDLVEDKWNSFLSFFTFPSQAEVSSFISSTLSQTELGSLIDVVMSFLNTVGNLLGVGIVAPTTLSFSFPYDLFGVTGTLVLDFSWYTPEIRNIVVAVFLTWFYSGLLIHIVFGFPNLIRGGSGVEKDIFKIR